MSKDVVKSVGRVFSVLELFKTHQKPLTATEVCNYLEKKYIEKVNIEDAVDLLHELC